VIISIYVSIFTALINLVVDFLFEDILLAPTMDSKGREKDLKLMNAKQQQDQQTDRSLTCEKRSLDKQMLQKTQSYSRLDLETTRVVPSATEEAHLLAALSVKDIVKERVAEIDQSVSKRDILRQASSNLKHKHSMAKHRSILKVRGESAKVKQNAKSTDVIEEQFVDLAVDITEQRKELKRSQQEKFDEMWG
jgi:hypothetical protein